MATIRRLAVLLVAVVSAAALGPVGAASTIQRGPDSGLQVDRVSSTAGGSSSSSYGGATYSTSDSTNGNKRSTSSLSPKMQYAIRHLSDSIWLNAIADSLPYYPDIKPAVPVRPYPSTGWSWPAGTVGVQPSGNGGPYYPGNGSPYYPGNGGSNYPGNGNLYPPGNGSPHYSGNGGLYPPGNGRPYNPPGNGGSYYSGNTQEMRPYGQRNSRESAPNASGADRRPGANDPVDSEVAGSK